MPITSEVSFDEFPELYSLLTANVIELGGRGQLPDLMKRSFPFIKKYLAMLPPVDLAISKYYFLQDMSQEQVSMLLGVSQAAVSRRLKFILRRLKFLLKMPSRNPIQVREDLNLLFPEPLFAPAYYFYWELTQNRVRHYIDTSQSGAANKFSQLLDYLEKIIEDESMEGTKEHYLACIYLDYFRYIRNRANVVTYLFKRRKP